MHELITILISKSDPKGLGKLSYKQIPRIGEWVEIEEEDNKAIMHEVIMVAHSSVGSGADIYVKRLTKLSSASLGLRQLV